MGLNWEFTDNYEHHNNGRIWLVWNPEKLKIATLEKSEQLIHNEVYDKQGKSHHLTIVYVHNQLANKRKLWEELIKIKEDIIGPWLVIGDFNNILKIEDMIGGHEVQAA